MSVFKTPENIYIGKDALQEAGSNIAACGKKALVVTGKHVAVSEMMKRLKELLDEKGIQYYIFDEITGEPTDEMILAGKKSYQEEKCDFLIGIGGGSSLDSAKAIALMAEYDGEIADFAGSMITRDLPAVIAIPTTAGTGSEATKFTVITDVKTDVKMLLKGDCLLPKIAIVDENYTVSAPKSITASTGLDALTHAVEAYTSKMASPLTDALAISAIKRILVNLPRAYQDGNDMEARHEMACAALEAGICINNSSVTIVHGMSRPIGALFHVPHGLSNAMLLYKCLSFVLDGAYDRFAILGREIQVAGAEDSDEEAAEKFLQAIKKVCEQCEVPTLQQYGIDQTAFEAVIPKMAKDAIASGSPGNTRKEVTQQDCMDIYDQLF